MWLSISDGSSRWKGQRQEGEEGNEDKQTNKMCLHWPEGKLKPPWPVVCCLFNEKSCWLPAACLSRKCEFNTNFEGEFLKLLCRQFAPPPHTHTPQVCLVLKDLCFFFFSHLLAFFKWLYWSFNQMYHQIYYTGRSVTDRTTIDEAPDHPLMTQKPSVFLS